MTHLPFEFIDRRHRHESLDSTTAPFETEGGLHDPSANPFGSLPTVAELKQRLRSGDAGSPTIDRSTVTAHSEIAIGVDVARFGSDSTAICVRKDERVIFLASYRNNDTMTTAGRVAATIRRFNPNHVFVDAIGIGAGVVDRLRELKFRNVKGVMVSAKARDGRRYANLRAEIFDNLRKRFENGTIQLPRDPELREQLAAVTYSFTSSGQMLLTPKEELSKHGLRSLDKADALALAFSFQRRRLNAFF